MHTLEYRIFNAKSHLDAPREISVDATPEQVQHLVEEGYLVRERLLEANLLERLRNVVDAIEAATLQTRKPGVSGGFGGLFVRNLLDLDPIFWELALQQRLLSVARAVLGPQVQIRATVLRVSYPDLPEQGVEWHFHQRLVPEPEPAFFVRPATVDNLIYLDDLTPDAGPLVVMPRSHLINEDLPSGDHSDKPGQVQVCVPAGSCVTSHSSLWHKALPTKPEGGRRRLVILGYAPVWLKQIDQPSAGRNKGWTDQLMTDADAETRELLGLQGFF